MLELIYIFYSANFCIIIFTGVNYFSHALKAMCSGFHCKKASYTISEISHTLRLTAGDVTNILKAIHIPVSDGNVLLMRREGQEHRVQVLTNVCNIQLFQSYISISSF